MIEIDLGKITGSDGKEIELQKTNTYIQWRLEGESLWNNLVSLSEIKGETGGRGDNGTSYYVHIRYGTSATPDTLLTTPNNYMGVYTGTSSSAPSTYDEYVWYKIKGESGGIDGVDGQDGANAYVHIRYGTSATPDTLLTTPNDYMGVYSGTSETAPAIYNDYVWYKIKGETGAPGQNGVDGVNGTDGIDGQDGTNAYVHIRYGTSTTPATLLTTPNDYMGIYSGTSATAPVIYSDYTWYKIKGETGAAGTPAAEIDGSAQLTLTVSGWSNKTQTVSTTIDTTKRNVIDVEPLSAEAWGNCGVVATSESSTGIAFKCKTVPSSALNFRIVSMEVNYDS